MGKIGVSEALRASLTFWKTHWGGAIGAQIVTVAAAVLEKVLDADSLVGTLLSLVSLVAQFMAYGALYRLALRPDHPDDPSFQPGANGFQWRSLEWNLLWLAALACIVVLIVVVAFIAVATGGQFGSFERDQFFKAASPTMIAGGAVAACALIYGFVRLSLAFALTADTRSLRFGWSLTRGQFWPILGANLALWFCLAVGNMLLIIIGKLGDGAMPPAVSEFLSETFIAFIAMPLMVGLGVALYRMVRDPAPAGKIVA